MAPVWSDVSFLVNGARKGESDLSGSELRFGFERGRVDAGQWGIAFTWNTIADGSSIRLDLPFLGTSSQFKLTGRMAIGGIEAHRFVPIANIASKPRLKVGIDLAGGIAIPFASLIDPSSCSASLECGGHTDLFFADVVPSGKVTAGVQVGVSPHLRLGVAGGFSYPGFVPIEISSTYFFGRAAAEPADPEQAPLPVVVSPRGEQTFWGFDASVVPVWNTPSAFISVFGGHGLELGRNTGRVTGSEFQVGVIRGNSRRGDWGLAFTYKTIDNASRILCSQCGYVSAPRGVKFAGVQLHRFIPLAALGKRAQFGVNLSGGAAYAAGQFDQIDAGPSAASSAAASILTSGSAADQLMNGWPIMPQGAAEAALNITVAPTMKFRVASGFNFPGYNIIKVSFLYFIGAY